MCVQCKCYVISSVSYKWEHKSCAQVSDISMLRLIRYQRILNSFVHLVVLMYPPFWRCTLPLMSINAKLDNLEDKIVKSLDNLEGKFVKSIDNLEGKFVKSLDDINVRLSNHLKDIESKLKVTDNVDSKFSNSLEDVDVRLSDQLKNMRRI